MSSNEPSSSTKKDADIQTQIVCGADKEAPESPTKDAGVQTQFTFDPTVSDSGIIPEIQTQDPKHSEDKIEVVGEEEVADSDTIPVTDVEENETEEEAAPEEEVTPEVVTPDIPEPDVSEDIVEEAVPEVEPTLDDVPPDVIEEEETQGEPEEPQQDEIEVADLEPNETVKEAVPEVEPTSDDAPPDIIEEEKQDENEEPQQDEIVTSDLEPNETLEEAVQDAPPDNPEEEGDDDNQDFMVEEIDASEIEEVPSESEPVAVDDAAAVAPEEEDVQKTAEDEAQTAITLGVDSEDGLSPAQRQSAGIQTVFTYDADSSDTKVIQELKKSHPRHSTDNPPPDDETNVDVEEGEDVSGEQEDETYGVQRHSAGIGTVFTYDVNRSDTNIRQELQVTHPDHTTDGLEENNVTDAPMVVIDEVAPEEIVEAAPEEIGEAAPEEIEEADNEKPVDENIDEENGLTSDDQEKAEIEVQTSMILGVESKLLMPPVKRESIGIQTVFTYDVTNSDSNIQNELQKTHPRHSINVSSIDDGTEVMNIDGNNETIQSVGTQTVFSYDVNTSKTKFTNELQKEYPRHSTELIDDAIETVEDNDLAESTPEEGGVIETAPDEVDNAEYPPVSVDEADVDDANVDEEASPDEGATEEDSPDEEIVNDNDRLEIEVQTSMILGVESKLGIALRKRQSIGIQTVFTYDVNNADSNIQTELQKTHPRHSIDVSAIDEGTKEEKIDGKDETIQSVGTQTVFSYDVNTSKSKFVNELQKEYPRHSTEFADDAIETVEGPEDITDVVEDSPEEGDYPEDTTDLVEDSPEDVDTVDSSSPEEVVNEEDIGSAPEEIDDGTAIPVEVNSTQDIPAEDETTEPLFEDEPPVEAATNEEDNAEAAPDEVGSPDEVSVTDVQVIPENQDTAVECEAQTELILGVANTEEEDENIAEIEVQTSLILGVDNIDPTKGKSVGIQTIFTYDADQSLTNIRKELMTTRPRHSTDAPTLNDDTVVKSEEPNETLDVDPEGSVSSGEGELETRSIEATHSKASDWLPETEDVDRIADDDGNPENEQELQEDEAGIADENEIIENPPAADTSPSSPKKIKINLQILVGENKEPCNMDVEIVIPPIGADRVDNVIQVVCNIVDAVMKEMPAGSEMVSDMQEIEEKTNMALERDNLKQGLLNETPEMLTDETPISEDDEQDTLEMNEAPELQTGEPMASEDEQDILELNEAPELLTDEPLVSEDEQDILDLIEAPELLTNEPLVLEDEQDTLDTVSKDKFDNVVREKKDMATQTSMTFGEENEAELFQSSSKEQFEMVPMFETDLLVTPDMVPKQYLSTQVPLSDENCASADDMTELKNRCFSDKTMIKEVSESGKPSLAPKKDPALAMQDVDYEHWGFPYAVEMRYEKEEPEPSVVGEKPSYPVHKENAYSHLDKLNETASNMSSVQSTESEGNVSTKTRVIFQIQSTEGDAISVDGRESDVVNQKAFQLKIPTDGDPNVQKHRVRFVLQYSNNRNPEDDTVETSSGSASDVTMSDSEKKLVESASSVHLATVELKVSNSGEIETDVHYNEGEETKLKSIVYGESPVEISFPLPGEQQLENLSQTENNNIRSPPKLRLVIEQEGDDTNRESITLLEGAAPVIINIPIGTGVKGICVKANVVNEIANLKDANMAAEIIKPKPVRCTVISNGVPVETHEHDVDANAPPLFFFLPMSEGAVRARLIIKPRTPDDVEPQVTTGCSSLTNNGTSVSCQVIHCGVEGEELTKCLQPGGLPLHLDIPRRLGLTAKILIPYELKLEEHEDHEDHDLRSEGDCCRDRAYETITNALSTYEQGIEPLKIILDEIREKLKVLNVPEFAGIGEPPDQPYSDLSETAMPPCMRRPRSSHTRCQPLQKEYHPYNSQNFDYPDCNCNSILSPKSSSSSSPHYQSSKTLVETFSRASPRSNNSNCNCLSPGSRRSSSGQQRGSSPSQRSWNADQPNCNCSSKSSPRSSPQYQSSNNSTATTGSHQTNNSSRGSRRLSPNNALGNEQQDTNGSQQHSGASSVINDKSSSLLRSASKADDASSGSRRPSPDNAFENKKDRSQQHSGASSQIYEKSSSLLRSASKADDSPSGSRRPSPDNVSGVVHRDQSGSQQHSGAGSPIREGSCSLLHSASKECEVCGHTCPEHETLLAGRDSQLSQPRVPSYEDVEQEPTRSKDGSVERNEPEDWSYDQCGLGIGSMDKSSSRVGSCEQQQVKQGVCEDFYDEYGLACRRRGTMPQTFASGIKAPGTCVSARARCQECGSQAVEMFAPPPPTSCGCDGIVPIQVAEKQIAKAVTPLSNNSNSKVSSVNGNGCHCK